MKELWARRANPADAAILQQLIHKAYKGPLRQGIRFAAAAIPLHRVRQNILTHQVYILFFKRNPVGSVTLRRRSFGYEISHLAVVPDSQGKGYGKRLLLFAEEQARVSGQRKVHLFTAEDHPWLADFYRKYGYKRIDKYQSKKGLWIGHYVKELEKPLV